MAKKQKYIVVTDFYDKQDSEKLYEAGQSFPRPVNKKISDERIEELLSKQSAVTGKPFIELEIEEEPETDKKEQD